MTSIIIYERKKKRKNNLDRIESEKTETWELKKDLAEEWRLNRNMQRDDDAREEEEFKEESTNDDEDNHDD